MKLLCIQTANGNLSAALKNLTDAQKFHSLNNLVSLSSNLMKTKCNRDLQSMKSSVIVLKNHDKKCWKLSKIS